MWKRVLRVEPVAQLSDAAFASRHRVLRFVLWLHVPVLTAVAWWTREATGHAGHGGAAHTAFGAGLVWLTIAAVAVFALLASWVRGRRGGAVVVSTGLMFAAAALVHAGGGLTDLHFQFLSCSASSACIRTGCPSFSRSVSSPATTYSPAS
jgi:methyl-accepting chemotaxis protein